MEKEQTKNQQEKNQQENQKKSQKLQWHPAFCSALRLELLEDAENLEFTDEFQLTEKPLQIDCTVVKVKKDCKIKNEIGKIFRKFTISFFILQSLFYFYNRTVNLQRFLRKLELIGKFQIFCILQQFQAQG